MRGIAANRRLLLGPPASGKHGIVSSRAAMRLCPPARASNGDEANVTIAASVRAECSRWESTDRELPGSLAGVNDRMVARVDQTDSDWIMNAASALSALCFLLIATVLEVSGDAIVRLAIYNHSGITRFALMLAGGILLLGYASSLILHQLNFGT